jgi:leucyl aminopeptidase
MELRHVSGSPLDLDTDLIAIAVYENGTSDPLFKAFDAALDGQLARLAAGEQFTGKPGQTLVIPGGGALKAGRLAVLGSGGKSRFGPADARELGARVVKLGSRVGAARVALALPVLGARQVDAAVQMVAEGALLGAYKFTKYLTGEDARPRPVAEFSVLAEPRAKGKASAARSRALTALLGRAQTVAAAICRARDYVNEPAEFMTPSQLADEARAVGRASGVKVKVFGRAEIDKLGMGMVAAVGRGSDNEPRLIHMSYTPKKKGKGSRRVALIGKGITFDSGGYSLKPSSGMLDMKVDMAGSAAVIAAMGALADLGCPHEVHAVVAACENMVSGRAYRLGDVLRSMDGTTVEINNTDAEGRLTLGDAITYTRQKIEPDEMFDFATLTGACVVALGPYTAGVMSRDERLVKGWLGAAEAAGEDMWRLPLSERLREQLKSEIADMRNTGERTGGAITAGLFLQTFAKDTPWVHVDIAGPASISTETAAVPKGGSGFAVATILEYLTR